MTARHMDGGPSMCEAYAVLIGIIIGTSVLRVAVHSYRGRPRQTTACRLRNPVASCRSVMAWIYLTVAGLLEIGWAIGLKYTDGFTRLLPSLWTITSMVLSIVLLGLAL